MKKFAITVEIVPQAFGDAAIGIKLGPTVRHILSIDEAENLSHKIQAQLSNARMAHTISTRQVRFSQR